MMQNKLPVGGKNDLTFEVLSAFASTTTSHRPHTDHNAVIGNTVSNQTEASARQMRTEIVQASAPGSNSLPMSLEIVRVICNIYRILIN